MCAVSHYIADKNYAKLFEAINEVVSSSKDILVFFADLTSFYRDMMVQKSNMADSYLELLPNESKLLEEAASRFNISTLIYHATLLDDAYANMIRNPANKRLCAEITLMKMCDPRLNTSSDAILSRLSSLEDKITLLSKGITPVMPVVEDTVISEEKAEEINTEISMAQKTAEDPTQSSNSLEQLECWDDIVNKVVEINPSAGSFLRGSLCYFSAKNNKYYLVTPSDFAKRLLDTEKNIKGVFDAMILNEIEINSPSQIKITVKKGTDVISDLDEFE